MPEQYFPQRQQPAPSFSNLLQQGQDALARYWADVQANDFARANQKTQEYNQPARNVVEQFLGPNLGRGVTNTALALGEMNPAADLRDMGQGLLGFATGDMGPVEAGTQLLGGGLAMAIPGPSYTGMKEATQGIADAATKGAKRHDQLVAGGLKSGQRKVASRASLSTDEKFRLTIPGNKSMQEKLQGQVRAAKQEHPVLDGWSPLESNGFKWEGGKPVALWKQQKYRFAQDPATGKVATGKKRETIVNRLAKRTAEQVRAIRTAAERGDPAAQAILEQSTWYSSMRTRLREDYGGMGDVFADMIGASSPQTNVEDNWRNAITALGQFTRGEFDDVLTKYQQIMETNNWTPSNYTGAWNELRKKVKAGEMTEAEQDELLPMIRKPNGTLYGANSGNIMKALVDMWRQRSGSPKAETFAGNLIGYDEGATVDVWAARWLDRMGNKKRIPPRAEGAVSGKFNKDGVAKGDYGFGQEVFKKAADELGMAPDDLQAVAWFGEKRHWVENRWGFKEGGDMFEMARRGTLTGEQTRADPGRVQEVERMLLGHTQQRDAPLPDDVMARGAADIKQIWDNDPNVVASNVQTSQGEFMDYVENSFDGEVVVNPGYDPGNLIGEIARQAQASNQDASFISRVIRPGTELPANARPGGEIYLRQKMDREGMKAITDILAKHNIHGYTMITDTRVGRGTSGAKAEQFTGLRFQIVPEFNDDMIANPAGVGDYLAEQEDVILDALEEIKQLPEVSTTLNPMYDTYVMGRGEYEGILQSNSREWPVQTVQESVERAAALRQ